MPNQHEIRWSQLKVGVLVLVAAAALIALISLMSGGIGGLFTRSMVVHSYFKNASGLQAGAPVNLQGVTIGSVDKLRIVAKRKKAPVEVIMKIGTQYSGDLRTDSTASLTTAGVLGNTFVDIDSTHATGPRLKNGDELPVKQSPSLADVIQSSETTISKVNTILAKVNTLADTLNSNKGTAGEFLNNPALYKRATATLQQAQGIVTKINRGQGTLGMLITDKSLYNRANDAVTHLQNIVDEIDAGQGTVGKLIKDPALYNNVNNLVGGINNGKGTLGMLAKDPAFRNRVNLTVEDMHGILRQANEGQGTIGKLLKDPTLYNNSNHAIVEMRDLLAAVRKNPKKYLVIRLKIF